MNADSLPRRDRKGLSRVLLVTINLYVVYVAVGGIAFLVSALSDRRGRAMAFVFGILLASFLLNFVGQFWEPANKIAFLGVLEYYQPAKILQGEAFPIRDLVVLLLVGGSTWLLGGEVVARRSICTV